MVCLTLYKDLIRRRIKEKFKTIENFSKHIQIPRTTINSILKNGVGSSRYDLVNKIFKELDIYPIDSYPIIIDEHLLKFLKIYNTLDDIGKHVVSSVAETEYRRVYPNFFENTIIAAYGGLSSSEPLTNDEKLILALVDKIKNKDLSNE